MKAIRLFLALVRWDVLREVRRKDTVPNMVLFALIVLFLARMGLSPDVTGGRDSQGIGTVVFWITVLFAGTVGLGQSVATEREGNALAGILTSPVDTGVLYLAKVASTTLYVLILELATILLYGVLFDAWPRGSLPGLIAVLLIFTLAYMAVGVVVAAMTTAVRGGGEVLLRILLFPLMIPMITLTLRVSETVFGTPVAGGTLGPPLDLGRYVGVGIAFDAVYLTTGFLLFPKILEE